MLRFAASLLYTTITGNEDKLNWFYFLPTISRFDQTKIKLHIVKESRHVRKNHAGRPE